MQHVLSLLSCDPSSPSCEVCIRVMLAAVTHRPQDIERLRAKRSLSSCVRMFWSVYFMCRLGLHRPLRSWCHLHPGKALAGAWTRGSAPSLLVRISLTASDTCTEGLGKEGWARMGGWFPMTGGVNSSVELAVSATVLRA